MRKFAEPFQQIDYTPIGEVSNIYFEKNFASALKYAVVGSRWHHGVGLLPLGSR